ncbi:kinase-like protein [Auricularia subglabra TFB-10046 SS5]|nr:kinase-like protein [Auricularia subglabra TFB-10046 SS5]
MVNEHTIDVSNLPQGPMRDKTLTRITLAVERMKDTLQTTRDDLSKISRYNTWNAIMRQDKIKQTIDDCRVELISSLSFFMITSQMGLALWGAEFKQASRADHEELMLAVQSLRVDSEERPSPSPIPDGPSTTHTSHDEVLRKLQARLRIHDPGTPEYTETETTLRNLQLTLNMPLLPVADLVFEARRVDPAPIHSSATAEVWRGTWLGDPNTVVAMKCLRVSMTPPNLKDVERFHRQFTMLRDIRHPNIIKLFGVCYVETNAYFVFPWMEHGNILAYLEQYPDADRMRMMLEVARGLAHLHAQHPPVVHRALQPSNVLVDKDGHAIVSDFGLAKALEGLDIGHNNTVSDGAQLRMRWMAPEMSDSSFGPPVDVYAWAMTTLHVMSELAPFYRIKQEGRVVVDVHNGGRPLRTDHPSEHLSDDCWALLEKCWKQSPAERPTVANVVQEICVMRPDLRD